MFFTSTLVPLTRCLVPCLTMFLMIMIY
jgi:hypothetical protein